ncbi:MAG: murein biosynthesis integral membrane protein MurJ [Treponema sp.]|nr:murein biosynthesis integral membrane protein MurJ [Treponema sp.]
MEKNNSRLSKASLLKHGSMLSLLTLISRILGLLREMTKARLLGTKAISDAFTVAFMLPNLFRRLFAEGSIAVAFIPTFKEYLLENDSKKTSEFVACIFTFLSFLVTLAVMAGILFSPYLINFFNMELVDETVLLTRIMFPFLAFISIAALFQGILNSHHIFTPSGLAPILLNIVTIACAYGLKDFVGGGGERGAARAMAYGILLGGFLEAAIQLPFVLKNKHRLFFTGLKRAFSNPGTKKVLRLIGPTIIGMAAYQMNDLVSTALAGHAGVGVQSSLQYSLRLQELMLGVFAVSLGTVLLPNLAEYAKFSRWEEFNSHLVSAMDIIALITIPITFFSISQGEILIRLLYESEAFNDESVLLTLAAFTYHMPGLFFIALNRILAPAFYAQSNSKSPTLAGIISFVVNIFLAASLVFYFSGKDNAEALSGGGIALALSIASAVNTVFLIAFLKKNPSIDVRRIIMSTVFFMLKLLLLSGIAVIPLYFISPYLLGLFSGSLRFVKYGIPLAINAVIFAALGIGLLYASHDKRLAALIRSVKRTGSRE